MSNMISQLETMLRPDVAQLDPYTPIQPLEVLSEKLGLDPADIIKLDANENPYGPVAAVSEALAQYAYYHIYPDPAQTELRKALSDAIGIPQDTILATHGADELLDYVCRLFLGPGDKVINCPPTFGMYHFDAAINGGETVNIWRDDEYAVDVDAIEQLFNPKNDDSSSAPATGIPKLLFLTSPNNPTGNWLDDQDLARLLTLPIMVVLDEAYVEFSQHESRVDWVAQHENLIVIRTFSKVAGLAGLRLGYGVCPEWIMPYLWKFKQPYNVNVAATVAGLASLRNRDSIETTAAKLRSERYRLYELLSTVSYLRPFPSEANFILCKVEGVSAWEIKHYLERNGVMVRYYSSLGLEDCIRISVGRPEHTDRLLTVLQQYSQTSSQNDNEL